MALEPVGVSSSGTSNSLDWPLSRDEKKHHVLRLYDQDLRASNSLLRSGESALLALQHEIRKIRIGAQLTDYPCVATTTSSAPMSSTAPTLTSEAQAAERLRWAIAEATEALGALLGAAAVQQQSGRCQGENADDEEDDLEVEWCAPRTRARSEGAVAARNVSPPPGALQRCGRKRRLSRNGDPLTVSFVEEASSAEKQVASPAMASHAASPVAEPGLEPEPQPEAEFSASPGGVAQRSATVVVDELAAAGAAMKAWQCPLRHRRRRQHHVRLQRLLWYWPLLHATFERGGCRWRCRVGHFQADKPPSAHRQGAPLEGSPPWRCTNLAGEAHLGAAVHGLHILRSGVGHHCLSRMHRNQRPPRQGRRRRWISSDVVVSVLRSHL